MSCKNYMIFHLYLFTIQCHLRSTWSLICFSSWFSVMYEIHDLWSVFPPGSVSCKNYMIFHLYLFTIQCHLRSTWSLICILLMVQCHVRITRSFICISSRFSVMQYLHDLWSVSPHGSVPCKNYTIFDLYLLVVQCHVRTTWSFICISSRFSFM